MTKLPAQFIEDRAIRDAAFDVLKADIEHAKVSLAPKGVVGRVGGRIGDGAKDVFEVAKTNADDNRGVLAILLGALALFLARGPILELFRGQQDDEEDAGEAAPDDAESAQGTGETLACEASPGDDNER